MMTEPTGRSFFRDLPDIENFDDRLNELTACYPDNPTQEKTVLFQLENNLNISAAAACYIAPRKINQQKLYNGDACMLKQLDLAAKHLPVGIVVDAPGSGIKSSILARLWLEELEERLDSSYSNPESRQDQSFSIKKFNLNHIQQSNNLPQVIDNIKTALKVKSIADNSILGPDQSCSIALAFPNPKPLNLNPGQIELICGILNDCLIFKINQSGKIELVLHHDLNIEKIQTTPQLQQAIEQGTFIHNLLNTGTVENAKAKLQTSLVRLNPGESLALVTDGAYPIAVPSEYFNSSDPAQIAKYLASQNPKRQTRADNSTQTHFDDGSCVIFKNAF
ncbi:MAG: hypothetical protein OHK0017_04650 [Patescibacteria group bacterium]